MSNRVARWLASVLIISTLVFHSAATADDGAANADDGFIDLFDGKSLDGWTTQSGDPVTKGWAVEDGVLTRTGGGGPIYAKGEFGDFELRFQWKIAARGNSGVKYRVAFYKKGVRGQPGWLGCEYQLLDDGSKTSKGSTGSIYALYAPNDKKQVKPVGQYNSSRIFVQGTKIEHWLNGELIVAADAGSDDWQQHVADSKFGIADGFFKNRTGRIQLQDHGSQVWFRDIKIRPIATGP